MELASELFSSDEFLAHNSLAVIPMERWDVDGTPSPVLDYNEIRFGSFVPDVQLFDAAAFNISSVEAVYVDPQQRLLLKDAAEVLQEWDSRPHQVSTNMPIARERLGVIVGVGPADYVNLTTATLPISPYLITGGTISVAAGR